jgi:serine/threonine protein phosphatase PrpC
MTIEHFTYSDKGPRTENQDFLGIKDHGSFFIACIADGVGGENCGHLAARTSVEQFIEETSMGANDLGEVVGAIHRQLKKIQEERKECRTMATTFTGCKIIAEKLYGTHAGDSRLCVLRGNGIKQLTHNHTEMDRFLRSGKLKYEDVETYPRRHILESALGISEDPTIQGFEFDLQDGDRIVFTTDGVHDIITKVEFRDISKESETLPEFANKLIRLLSERKPSDNMSFILLALNSDIGIPQKNSTT